MYFKTYRELFISRRLSQVDGCHRPVPLEVREPVVRTLDLLSWSYHLKSERPSHKVVTNIIRFRPPGVRQPSYESIPVTTDTTPGQRLLLPR